MLRLAIVVSSLFLIWPAQAAEYGLGLNYFNFDYSEELAANQKSHESGNLLGFAGGIRWPLPTMGSGTVLEIEGEGVFEGSTNYEGTTFSGTGNAFATDKQTIYRFETRLSRSLSESIGVHAGLGYRYWNRYLTFGTGYKEIYSWYTLPVGLSYQVVWSSALSVCFDFTYSFMFNGKIKVIFSETVINGDDSEMSLGSRPGYRLKAPISYRFDQKFRIEVSPWYERSEIGESNSAVNNTPQSGGGTVGSIREPSSHTDQYGVAAMLWITY